MTRTLRLLKWFVLLVMVLLALALALLAGSFWYARWQFDESVPPEGYGQVESALFAGDSTGQPLLVGLGGAEGGNAWASDYWRDQRDRFIAQGFAVLGLAYFGSEGSSRYLDRVSLNAVHDAIMEAARDPRINHQCIVVMGGSKGAELALMLASQFPDIKAVVGIVPGSAIFPALTATMNTSSFALDDQPLPFVPVPWSAMPELVTGDLRGVWEKMMQNSQAMSEAAIPVENINGPIFLLSATQDEFWPSTEMSQQMQDRLTAAGYAHPVEHVAIVGGHGEPLNHFAQVEDFLARNVLSESSIGCPRP